VYSIHDIIRCSLCCVTQAVRLTGENHKLVDELDVMTAQREIAVAAALAATDEKNRLQDQVQ
jgi:hypothetical protein